MEYQFTEIERRIKKYWNDNELYKVKLDKNKPKYYVLDMFPYPSGAGLHVGHPLGYIATDIYSRYKRLCGYNVLHPMGYDSFGLPAEQYAIETGQHPIATTEQNINRYREQLDNIGLSFDWSREVRTSDPNYYKWTQWIFSQLFNSWYNPSTNKAEKIETLIKQIENGTGPISKEELIAFTPAQKDEFLMKYRLAYRSYSYVNWCEALGTVLANDEIVNGVSERGGHPVERKLMNQWFLRITAYADRLLDGLQQVDYPESLKEMQRNWIGRSEGALVKFDIEKSDKKITVFTTRPDTIYGVSFMVLAPELDIIEEITSDEYKESVQAYIKYVKSRSEIERMSDKKISGCNTGAFAIHPLTGNKIPIWIAEYVLAGYGTGAIMAVPAGDERDYKFAQHFGINIPQIFEESIEGEAMTDKNATLKNSESLNGMRASEAISAAIALLESKNIGTSKINYKFRDAGFSRQRYWGEPFPVYYDRDGVTHVDTTLPVELPNVPTYGPGPEGKGPLANLKEWRFQNGIERETDTMPGYAGSSWYFLRYMDPQNQNEFASQEAMNYWNQVDVYAGGAEHAVGHLLYSRMWCKVLHDLGYVPFDEPYKKIIHQGMIQGSSRLAYRISGTNKFVSYNLKNEYNTDEIYVDVSLVDDTVLDIEKFKKWRQEYESAEFILENNQYICGTRVEKMSKRLYNVVNPDDIIAQYGADTFRMYEMFLGPIELSKPWDTKGIEGVHRFMKKLFRHLHPEDQFTVSDEEPTREEYKILHKHIKKIIYDIENFSFNTSVSQFMISTNELSALNCNKRKIIEPFIITLVPFAPHFAEYCYQQLGHSTSVLDAQFPEYDESYLVENEYTYPIAINGKTKLEKAFPIDASADFIQSEVIKIEKVQQLIEGKEIKKFIFVPKKMINLVIG